MQYISFEKQYLSILQEIIDNGTNHGDRTGVGRRSITSRMMKIDLSKEFPLVTTQKIFVRGAFEELRWMLSGSVNIQDLHKEGIYFWDRWAVKEEHLEDSFLETLFEKIDPPGLNNEWLDQDEELAEFMEYARKRSDRAEIGSIGKLYGENLRGRMESDGDLDYTVDQIFRLVHNLEVDRYGSRHIFSTFDKRHTSMNGLSSQENVILGLGGLFPCHGIHTQFQVLPQGEGKKDILHAFVTARSQDWTVGTPINVAFYAFLTHAIAKHIDADIGELTYVGCDIHVYKNQIDKAMEQLKREPLPAPQIELHSDVIFDDEYNFQPLWGDIMFTTQYTHHEHVKYPIAV